MIELDKILAENYKCLGVGYGENREEYSNILLFLDSSFLAN